VWDDRSVQEVTTAKGSQPPLAKELREKRAHAVASEIEEVALGLFRQRGFADVTVEEISSASRISPRTFYRYFPTKEDVLQFQIDRRSGMLRERLFARPDDEAPLVSLRLGITQVLAAEDTDLVRCWTEVVSTTTSVLRSIIGGIQLKSNLLFAEFLADRLGLAADALVPTMLAAAVGGVIQASQTHWYIHGGDLASTVSEGLRVVEHGFGHDLASWAGEGMVPDWPR
jgi:TetR/AcrR family transcriptional regulator, regulator of mycofactocin system